MSQDIVFERITTREGLSQNDVNDIYQDENGFLWIGTNDGLNRYDGYNFKTFRVNLKNENGISSNLIFKISEDGDGNLWLGTSDEGVCKFDVQTEKFTVFKNSHEDPNLLTNNQIITLLPAKNGSVWIGTGQGVDILTQKGKNYSIEKIDTNTISGIEAMVVTDIEEDLYERMWVGTKQGLFIFKGIENLGKLQIENSLYFVKDIFIKGNEVYIAYSNGVFQLKLKGENLSDYELIKISDVNADCILVSENGDLFMGTNQGLFVLDKNGVNGNNLKKPILFNEGWESNSISKNVVTSLFEDKSGIIWIGTNGGGINKYNPRQKKFRHFNKTRINGSLSYNKIRVIFEDSEKNIWFGTEGGGINFLSKTENKNYTSGFQYLDVNSRDAQNRAYSIVELTKKGQVEVLAGVGYPSVVQKIQVKNNVPQIENQDIFANVKNSPFAMLKSKDGTIWLGTYGRAEGLLRYTNDGKNEQLITLNAEGKTGDLSSNNIRSLLQDNIGNIWVGTDDGLNLLTPEEQKKEQPHFILFKNELGNPKSISHNYILPIFQSKDGIIWIGTMGGGLNRMRYHSNPDSIQFSVINTDSGLPNNAIKGILEDDFGFLWISSNKGLTRYDIKDKLIVNYDISDGLQDYEFSELACCKLSDGEMLFGGVNGFNAFYPIEIFSDMSIPEIALTDFHILNRSVVAGEKVNGRVVLENVINHTEKIRLKYNENSFAIYFSSLHFSAPAKNEYKYILEGFEKEWIHKDASDRIAKYTNLRPGRYTFKVLASNNDGVWTNDAKILEITITPPWYLSFVAWLVYVLIFIASLWFFQKYSLIRIKQKNELLMEHFEKEKIQELSQMKLRFFTNISHEFRTPLTLIIGPLEKLIRQGSLLSEKRVAASYAIMHRNASILLRLINQLVDFRKFEQGKMKLRASESNLISFLNEVFLSFSELAENKNISYHFLTPRGKIPLWFDADKFERIMYNLLSNAFKFTPEGGKIDLNVEEDDFNIIIRVADNGIGIPKDMQQHIFERFYQTERIVNRKVGSTGIGLSFIKGLVEMHKGEITFESEEDKGTTFILKLKKGNAHLEKEEMIAVTQDVDVSIRNYSFLEPVIVNEENEEGKKKAKTKILLVEDNFELKQFIKDSLSEKYNVFLAENGKDGLDQVNEINPEVIVSDIMMPVMNGFELCEAVKTNEVISHIPVILLTAKTTAENRIKGYNLGADGYISKPFSIEVLEARIQNLIESRDNLKKLFRTNISVEPSQITTTSMDEKFLQRILKIIEENIPNSEFTVEQLASDYGMSQIVLNKKLKGLTGQTAKAFIRSIRLKRAAQLFATGKYSVSDVTYEVGFSDLKYFRNCFKDEFGMSPSDYTRKHKPKEL